MANTPSPYGESPPRTGLVVSMGPLPAPVPIEPAGIIYDQRQQFDQSGRPLTVMEQEQSQEQQQQNQHAA